VTAETEVHIEAEIASSPERVFDTLVDLRNYGAWLSREGAYPGTVDISDGPMAVGTTYVERGATGVRHGTITELRRPAVVVFHQPMTLRPAWLGIIDITVRQTLTPTGGGVRLDRVVHLVVPRSLRPARAIVAGMIRRESARTVAALKAHTEGPA
jgi:uncharacterized protein YndB with AHSA1/START domain